MKSLIFPGSPEFDHAICTLPPDWRTVAEKSNGCAHVVDLDTGLLRTVTEDGLNEYFYGGEYDARMQELGCSEDWEFEALPEDEETGEWIPEEFLEPDEVIHIPYAI